MFELLSAKPNAPVSTATAVASVFLPASLIIYLDDPSKFEKLETAKLMLLSAAIGFPVLLLWAFFSFMVYFGLASSRRIDAGESLPTPAESVFTEPEFEWNALWMGGAAANTTLYVVAAVAFFRTIDVGRTMLLVAAGLVLADVAAFGVAVGYIVYREYVRQCSASTPKPLPQPPLRKNLTTS